MKRMLRFVLVCAVGALTLQTLQAADVKPATPAPAEKKADKPPAKARLLPFRGEIKSIDQTAKTFGVGERTFAVTSESKLFKLGKPATFDEVKVGDYATGAYKEAAGKLEVATLRVGPKPQPRGEKPADKPAK